jgi:hypothetical protein
MQIKPYFFHFIFIIFSLVSAPAVPRKVSQSDVQQFQPGTNLQNLQYQNIQESNEFSNVNATSDNSSGSNSFGLPPNSNSTNITAISPNISAKIIPSFKTAAAAANTSILSQPQRQTQQSNRLINPRLLELESALPGIEGFAEATLEGFLGNADEEFRKADKVCCYHFDN